MAKFSVSVDLSDVLKGFPDPSKSLVPLLHSAVQEITQRVRADWQESVQRAHLWEGDKRKYIESLETRETGPFSMEVRATYKAAHEIEEGRPAYDLKKMLNSSLKVRVSAKGRKYLIIPFRHNTPGNTAHAPAMPTEVYEQAKALTASKIIGHGRRISGAGALNINTREPITVRQRQYLWGGRMPAGSSEAVKGKDRYAGMVRMQVASSGREKRSMYMTFRVMSEGSSGWIIPARPGLWIARDVAAAIQPKAEHVFREAIQRTLNSIAATPAGAAPKALPSS